jgi:hypothetical protein
VTVALLRQREADVHEAERRVAEVDDTVIALEADIRDLKDQVERREQRVILADREVGFLQALVVRSQIYSRLTISTRNVHRLVSQLKSHLKNWAVIDLSLKLMKLNHDD